MINSVKLEESAKGAFISVGLIIKLNLEIEAEPAISLWLDRINGCFYKIGVP